MIIPGAFSRHKTFDLPDFDKVLIEAKERGVRLKTLYEEYVADRTDPTRAMALTTFYRNINAIIDKKDVVLTFNYAPGEMIQVDFVGRKRLKQPTLLDATGKEVDYEIFCAASAKSRKTFLLAITSQAKLPVLDAFAKMLAFYDGVPVLVTIDNFKAAVAKPRRGNEEAKITPEFIELSAHYGFGLIAARVRKPRDKGIVENAVGIAQDHVLAPLRNRQFFSLAEMNTAFAVLIEKLNSRPMKTHEHASRNDLFEREDTSGFEALPKQKYEPGKYFVGLRAGRDYHITVCGTRYSIPHWFANSLFDVKVTETSAHFFLVGKM